MVKQSIKWKLEQFDKGQKNATKMARFLIDVLFDRQKILNYKLDDLIKNEKDKMIFLLSYVGSFYRLTSLTDVRASISDKLSHFKGRTKQTPKKKFDSESLSSESPLVPGSNNENPCTTPTSSNVDSLTPQDAQDNHCTSSQSELTDQCMTPGANSTEDNDADDLFIVKSKEEMFKYL